MSKDPKAPFGLLGRSETPLMQYDRGMQLQKEKDAISILNTQSHSILYFFLLLSISPRLYRSCLARYWMDQNIWLYSFVKPTYSKH